MLMLSFGLVCAGAVLGLLLAALHGLGKRLPLWSGLVHASAGLSGLGVLLVGLGGPPRGVALGGASFGPVAAAMLGAAALAGLLIFALRLRGARLSVLLIGLHATVALFGVVVLAAYLSFPA
jgi:hypothetical protein